MKIYTHIQPDLDAAAACWAVMRFGLKTTNVPIYFKSANWDGSDAESSDIVVDMDCGIKGHKHGDMVGSATREVMNRFSTEKEVEIAEPLLAFIDAQDMHGNAVEHILKGHQVGAKDMASLKATSLNAIWRALFRWHEERSGGSAWAHAVKQFSNVLDGLFDNLRDYQWSLEEAKRAIWFGDRVALIHHPKTPGVTGALFDDGAYFVVYADGNNLGVVRSSKIQSPRAKTEEVERLVKQFGEESSWFEHPAGFLFCRGSRKGPVESPSKVPADKLAQAVSKSV